jgi:hypothetical protein
MYILNGLLDGQQSIAGTKRDRQYLLRLCEMRIQQAFHEHTHLPGRPPLGFVVHRNNTPDMQWRFGFLAHDFVLRDFHPRIHPPLPAGHYPPGQHHIRPDSEQLLEERLVKEYRLETSG